MSAAPVAGRPGGRAPAHPAVAEFAAEVGETGPVAARGKGTAWTVGGHLAPEVRIVAAPAGVVDHTPAEMTVRVLAGTPVAELDAVLADRGQRCALPERGGTVGGAVAVGHDHLSRRGRGTVAASVLQVRYVSAEGRVITGGGPTVKNVTGFDLPRLMVGSLGTLGLVAEVILRTNPRPVTACWLRSDDADPFSAGTTVLRPGSVLWDGGSSWVELEGHAPDVAADRARLGRLGHWVEVGGPPPLPPHRWSLTPARLRDLVPGTAEGSEPLPLREPGTFVASIGVGTVWSAAAPPPRTVSPPVAALSARLKHNFDPDGRLAPGRSLGRS
ncbi:MAG: FAD-binding protein [Acidimicrobiales bacterium]